MFQKLALSGVAALCATLALADPVEKRTAAMDQIRFGTATMVPMMKGDKPFDAAQAELALRMTYAGAIAFHGDLFPLGSMSKGANPAIWENQADFDAKRAEFLQNAKAAVATPPLDVAQLKAAYQPLLGNCAACHKAYRIK